MGVKGLRNYIIKSSVDKALRNKINILEEIEKWRSVNDTKAHPIIIIDIKEFSHLIAQRDEIAMVLGGRYHLYNKYFGAFFHKLQKCGVKLVFFFAGCKLTDDLMLFIPKRESEYVKYLEILDGIEAGTDVKKVLSAKQKYNFSPDRRASLTIEFNLKKICQKHGDLYINYVRHNQEIAQFVEKHNDKVMAIITNDTDFMVFEGNYQYWSSNDIDMKEMTGTSYDRMQLRANLQLNTKQLHLLSALSGSNYLPVHALKPFYDRIWDKSTKECRVVQVANYIRKLPIRNDSSIETFDLKKIAEDVFGIPHSPYDINAIENGITQYNLNFITDETDRRSFVKFCKDNNSFIYKLMTDDIYLIKDIMYIDYRNYKSKNYAELIMPLLRKVQGILWNDKRDKRTTRTFCMKYAHDEPYCVKEESIIFPEVHLPDLFDLIFKNKEKKWEDTRWSLCKWIFDFESNFINALRQMPSPEKYTAVVITIKYLLQQEEITEDEADAILVTEHFARSLRSHAPRIEYPTRPNAHFVRVAHLYTKLYELVCHCLEVSGLFHFADLILFDGPYFHRKCDKFSTKPNEKDASPQPVEALRIYLK